MALYIFLIMHHGSNSEVYKWLGFSNMPVSECKLCVLLLQEIGEEGENCRRKSSRDVRGCEASSSFMYVLFIFPVPIVLFCSLCVLMPPTYTHTNVLEGNLYKHLCTF